MTSRLGLFSPDDRNVGGRFDISAEAVRHRRDVHLLKPSIDMSAPFTYRDKSALAKQFEKEKKANTGRFGKQKVSRRHQVDLDQVHETFRRVKEAKTATDSQAPGTYLMAKVLSDRRKRHANTLQSDHEKNIAHMHRRMADYGSLSHRRKNEMDPFVYPVFLKRPVARIGWEDEALAIQAQEAAMQKKEKKRALKESASNRTLRQMDSPRRRRRGSPAKRGGKSPRSPSQPVDVGMTKWAIQVELRRALVETMLSQGVVDGYQAAAYLLGVKKNNSAFPAEVVDEVVAGLAVDLNVGQEVQHMLDQQSREGEVEKSLSDLLASNKLTGDEEEEEEEFEREERGFQAGAATNPFLKSADEEESDRDGSQQGVTKNPFSHPGFDRTSPETEADAGGRGW